MYPSNETTGHHTPGRIIFAKNRQKRTYTWSKSQQLEVWRTCPSRGEDKLVLTSRLFGEKWHLQLLVECVREDWLAFVCPADSGCESCRQCSSIKMVSLYLGRDMDSPRVTLLLVSCTTMYFARRFNCIFHDNKDNRGHCTMQEARWLVKNGILAVTSSPALLYWSPCPGFPCWGGERMLMDQLLRMESSSPPTFLFL